MKERLQQLINTNEFEFLKTMSEEDIWKFAFAILYVFSEREERTGHCNSCKWYDEDGIYNPNAEERLADLEQQLDDLIKNADKEEDKERFRALKVLAKYHIASQISTSIDHYADGRYDLTICFNGCHRRF